MAIAGHDLARGRLDAETELSADVLRNERVAQRVGAYSPGDRTHGNGLTCRRETLRRAVSGKGEAGELVAECRGLRLHAMGAPDAYCFPVPDRLLRHYAAES